MRVSATDATVGGGTRQSRDVQRDDVASAWRLRSFGGHEMSEEQLAVVSGPLIALVVGFVGVVLGLAVVWRGDVSETAAGFWPPAGVRWPR